MRFEYIVLENTSIDMPYSTSQNFVRKKAALTLLRLYRKHPEVIPAAEWALRIVALMDDMDLVRHLLHPVAPLLTSEIGSCDLRHKFSDGIGSRSFGRLCCMLSESS